MNTVHLAAIDLNLLVVLRELLRTASTTAAAKKLGRTQSAISHALSRLRALLDDPLFVRVGAALRPTTFAESLGPALDDLLARAESLFAGRGGAFDPKGLSRTFVIGATDYTEVLVLPPLLARLKKEAPNVDVATSFFGDDIERAIQSRDVDLAIGTRFRAAPAIALETVADEEMRVVVRKGHPATRGRLDAKRFAAFEHALVTPRGTAGGVVDTALEAVGLRRRVVMRVPHFVAAVMIVAKTDLVVTVPRAFAELMATEQPVTVLKCPVVVPPFRFSVAYATTTASDPAHAWFRKLFVEVAAKALGWRG